jgi:four helix bundle protein
MKDYKKLVVWENAHKIVLEVYQLTKSFPTEERYGLVSQFRRSAMSIPTNIAEGCGKFSQNDFASYLQIALGSTQETEYLCLLSKELGYIDRIVHDDLSRQVGIVKAMLISFIKKIRKP